MHNIDHIERVYAVLCYQLYLPVNSFITHRCMLLSFMGLRDLVFNPLWSSLSPCRLILISMHSKLCIEIPLYSLTPSMINVLTITPSLNLIPFLRVCLVFYLLINFHILPHQAQLHQLPQVSCKNCMSFKSDPGPV